jgi:UDP-glucose 4-epimerase
VIRELVKRGEKPIIFDIAPKLGMIKEVANQVKMIKGDIKDFHQIADAIKSEQVDQIIHMAYLPHALFPPNMSFKVNLIGTFNVLEAARILDVKKVVFISSWNVYGGVTPGIPMPEDYPKTPGDIYGAGKLALEVWGGRYADIYGMDFTALRFHRIYGPGRLERESPAGVEIDLMVVNSVHGKPHRTTAGDERVQLLYIKDVANAVLLASDCERPKNRVFNIGSEEYFSIREIAEHVRELIPSANITVVPAARALPAEEKEPGKIRGLDYKAAREQLGYAPQYTLKSGLEDFIDWIRLSK